MTNKTELEQLMAIRDGAPDGAVGIKVMDGFFRWYFGGSTYSKIIDNDDFYNCNQIERSLSDINRMIELLEQNEKLQSRTDEMHWYLAWKKATKRETELLEELEAVKRERDELEDDLISTQKSFSELETKHEDVELFFCDEDGCPLIEPLTSNGLESWFKKRDLEHEKWVQNYLGLTV